MPETVIGIGVDLVEISRIGDLISRHGDRFLTKALTGGELERIGLAPGRSTYATRHIAAKEAAMKALGTGLRPGTAWLDIEIFDRGPGLCDVSLPAGRPPGERMHMAISRHGGVVLAVATLVRVEEDR